MNRVPASAVRSVKESVDQPFQKLETQALSVGSDLLRAVTSMLKSAKVLDSDLWSDSPTLHHRPLRRLVALQDLEVFGVGFSPPQDLILEDLMALKNFRKCASYTYPMEVVLLCT